MLQKNSERLEALKASAKRLSHAKGKRANAKTLVATPEEKNATTTPATTGGRKTLIATQTPAETQKQIAELLNDLRDATDAGDKKRIRRALRLRGHRGGLSHERNATPATK